MLLRRLFLALLWVVFATLLPTASRAEVKEILVPLDAAVIDLLPGIERFNATGESISIQTAPDREGLIRRIEVRARDPQAPPAGWIAFALRNDSAEQMQRLIVAPHFRFVGSGVIWPDLGRDRVSALSTNQGERPERQAEPDADAFLITLDPGSVVTVVAELRSRDLPQFELWRPEAYKERTNSLTLYRGILLGISGLLALFLTMVFVVRGSIIFPAAAAIAWAVFGYLGIDFGFFAKLFTIEPRWERVYRASTEAVLAATLLTFLFAYLNLSRWRFRYWTIIGIWLALLIGLVVFAVFNSPVAAGISRISIAAVAALGLLLVIGLSFYRNDRAILLVPSWLVLCGWVAAAWFIVDGQWQSELALPALLGGLVLLVMLLAFTVLQQALAGMHEVKSGVPDAERKALALIGADDTVFDWEIGADHVFVGPELEYRLGLKTSALDGPVGDWVQYIHPEDRETFRAALDAIAENGRGRLGISFRMHASDGRHFWLQLKARPVIDAAGQVTRIVGTVTDITESRMAEDRLLHDAVHDHLTGLPNRQLFLDRLDASLALAAAETRLRPVLLLIDIDRFQNVNDALGLSVGDSILLTVSRRMSRLMKPQDTLARLSGDRFAAIIVSETDESGIEGLVEMLTKAIVAPVTFADREIFLTASIGIAAAAAEPGIKRDALIKNAELALSNAKRKGGDAVIAFDASLRNQRSDRFQLENDLRRAVERGEMRLVFQPIVRLEDRTIAGFEALLRWDHPRHGRLPPSEFISIAEETGQIAAIGLYALDRAAQELAQWQQALNVDPPLFASVNVSSRQLIRHDLLNDVRSVLAKHNLKPGTLKLEITESLVMENPEFAAQILTRIRDLGAGLSLDDFGTGYSSLSYLQRFPFDTIKIDKSFVRQDGRGGRPVILRTMISLAHDLGMTVVAEGAETEGDTIELYQYGCEYAQGFVFGEPMTAEQARNLVTKRNRSTAA